MTKSTNRLIPYTLSALALTLSGVASGQSESEGLAKALDPQSAPPFADHPDLLESIQADYLRMQPEADGYSAHSLGGGMSMHFDGQGFLVEPAQGQWCFGLRLSGFARGATHRSLTAPEGHCSNANELSYEWNEELTEWWRNDPRGLEHGFTVYAPKGVPTSELDSMLALELSILGDLQPEVSTDQRSLFGNHPSQGRVLSYGGLHAFDAAGRPLEALLALQGSRLQIRVEAQDALYPIVIDPIIYGTMMTPQWSWGYAGTATAIQGDTVAIGIPSAYAYGDYSAGRVNVVERSGTNWNLQVSLTAAISLHPYFGYSLALDGDTLVVGAPGEDRNATGVNGSQNNGSIHNSGAAFVYTRSGSTWTLQAYLKASNTDEEDAFGTVVAIDGDTIAVSSLFESSQDSGINGSGIDNNRWASGAVYVFHRTGTTWSHEAYIKASNPDSLDLFGSALAISGDTLVVGARGEDSHATTVNGDETSNLASSAGAAYVFERSGSTWTQQAYLKALNAGSGDEFGGALDIEGDRILVGAKFEDGSARGVNNGPVDNARPDSGAVYEFQRTLGNWTSTGYWKATNSDPGDLFGQAVQLSENRAVVTSASEDSDALGANGDPNNNLRPNSGAAYLLELRANSWIPTAYLKPSVAGANDSFGSTASLRGNKLAIGRPGWDSGKGAVEVIELGQPGELGSSFCSLPANNSTGLPGQLMAIGNPIAASNDVTMIATQLPANVFGFFLNGTSLGTPFQPAGSQGLLCLGGSLGRYNLASQIRNSGPLGEFSLVLNLVQTPQIGGPVAIFGGQTWYFQAWYRDSASGMGSSNFTNGVAIPFR